jgi:putative ABC transport system permease protein
MILYTLKSAFKYLWSSWRFTILNITGLALGLAITIMMVMLIHYELSFDNFHPNRDRILQVIEHDLKADDFSTSCPIPLPSTIINEFPEVQHTTGIWTMVHREAAFTWNEREYSGFTGASVDTGIFDIFRFELLAGNREYLLEEPDQIVVSERFVNTIFGQDDPLGQIVSIRDYPFTVSGIFRDLPDNSTVKFDVLFSEKARAFVRSDYKTAWWNGGMKTYVILYPGTDIKAFEKHLQEIPERHYPDFLKGRSTFITRPFKGSHFDTSVHDFNPSPVPLSYLFILASITVITLIIASINYINLSTAQSAKRNVDSGLRRIFGARSSHVVRLHLLFAYLSVSISFLISLVICLLTMPFIEYLTQRPLTGQLPEPVVWLILIGTVILVGFITGYIPGRTFVRSKPVDMINTKGTIEVKTGSYRNGLVIFQFTLTLILIISQMFILKQVMYMKNADLGFNNENLLAIDINVLDNRDNEVYASVKLFREETERYRTKYGFSEGTITEDIPGYYYENSFLLVPTDAILEELLVISTAVDEYFTDVYEIDMVEGRFFSPDFQTDYTAFIINETALKKIGWEGIDGKFMKYHHESQSFPVVGVIRDIHATSLKEPIKPMVYRFGEHNNFPGFITFRISPEKRRETVEFMEDSWQKMFPGTPFIWFDVKEKYFENYTEEKRISRIIGSFTLMAIVLSMLGLFGLVSFLAEQRQKEIGIRKVNGARTGEVMLMMNKVFVKWMAIAFVISCPVTWYMMQKWLQEFAYHTRLSLWVFILAGIIAMFIALLTVSWQSWRAARMNPANSLRYE